jgi:superfamily II DNA/RNA helicase
MSDLVKTNGGLHVVLSYIPSNIRVEVQGFGRAARKGEMGSGRFIVQRNEEEGKYRDANTLEEIKAIRDLLEMERLKKIEQLSLPKIYLEEKVFTQFQAFYQQTSQRLIANEGNNANSIF